MVDNDVGNDWWWDLVHELENLMKGWKGIEALLYRMSCACTIINLPNVKGRPLSSCWHKVEDLDHWWVWGFHLLPHTQHAARCWIASKWSISLLVCKYQTGEAYSSKGPTMQLHAVALTTDRFEKGEPKCFSWDIFYTWSLHLRWELM